MYTWIDVWAKWWIVTINDKLEVVYMQPVPRIKGEVDRAGLRKILEELEWPICIEDVHSIFGSSAWSNFAFWYIKWFMIACLQGKDFILVQPKERQKTAWCEDDIVYKKITPRKVKDTKATSLNAANRIFWNVDWKVWSQRSQQDGLYDAGLMAYFLYKKLITRSK